MKFTKLFMLGLAGMAFAACSSDDEPGFPGGEGADEGKVFVTLSLGRAESGRGLEQTADGKYNNVNALRVVFYDGSNIRQDVPMSGDPTTVGGKNAAAIAGAITALENGHQTTLALEGVPMSAERIYIIANEPRDMNINTGSWDLAGKTQIKLGNMYDPKAQVFGQENSIMTGYAVMPAATTPGGNGVATSTVSVEVKPVSSRIEIAKFTAAKITAPNPGETVVNVRSFDVKGIYINSFFPEGSLYPVNDDNLPGRNAIDNGPTSDAVNNYTYAYYSQTNYGFMCDEYAERNEPFSGYNEPAEATSQATTATTTTSWEVVPAVTGSRWGYPVLQGKVPHIVVCLDVVYDNEPVENPQHVTKYLTIDNYKVSGGTDLAGVERGKVYVIEDMLFDINDLTDEAYEGEKTVSATVTIAPWTAVAVTPDYQ